jgi:hypothetical protein
MKTFLTTVAAMIALSTTIASATVDPATICKVFDPTTTPLNVRTLPGNCRTRAGHDCSTNGRIIGTLDNGVDVEIRDGVSVQGNPWVFVTETTIEFGLTGWVYRPYLTACHRDFGR